MIDCKREFKAELDNIWAQAKDIHYKDRSLQVKERGYAIEAELEENALMFLGMNPSFREGSKLPPKGKEYDFYPLPQNENDKYFGKAYIISQERNALFCHHDLMFIRETSQEAVINSYKEHPDFFNSQLSLSKKIIEQAKPKMIVIINAKACELFREMFKFKPFKNWDEKLGVDVFNIAGRDIPVVFSGMLTGAHPLDNGTYTSLRWHIGYICDNWPGKITF